VTVMAADPIERETTLVVCSDQPDQVYAAIADISQIPGVRLGSAEKIFIRDTYFDTPRQALQAIRWGLRIREHGSSRLITLKGPARRSERGVMERTEIEEEWSSEALSKVLGKLRQLGPNLPGEWESGPTSSPVAFMQSLGLSIVQQRETMRLLRKVFGRGGDPSLPDAELALDRVTYSFDDLTAIHYEVELEALSPRGIESVAVMASHLTDTFCRALRLWEYGKLATGRALERLHRQGSLKPHINNGLLLPSAYDEIGAILPP
jgi:hypothetical protein